MTLRPNSTRSRTSGKEVLDYEIVQEQAVALGRLGRALEVALAALSGYDHAQAVRSENLAGFASSAAAIRQRLVQEASYALWCFIVQREACGLRDQQLIVRDYRVPREVQNGIGVFGCGHRPPSA